MGRDAGIVVVGAGPTGLTVACQLWRRGVPCRLVEERSERTRSSRAIGLSTRSLEILDEIGVASDGVELGRPLRAANLYARGRRIGRVGTSRLRWTRFPFTLSLPQSETERLLETRLEALGGEVERGVSLVGLGQGDGSVELDCAGPDGIETGRAAWVVGADGAHSSVRRLAGIEFSGEATEIVFTIADAEIEGGPAADEAHYFFSSEGLLVVIPLPGGGYRIAATVSAAEDEEGMRQNAVQELVARRAPQTEMRVGSLSDAGWGASRVRIHTRMADAYRVGRCFLAGDAAHVHSPVGGQGLNVGIQDAHNLAWKLALAGAGSAPESLLGSYEAERRPAALLTQKAVTAQTRLATIGSRLGGALRDGLVGRASGLGALDRRLAPQLAQLRVTYADGPVTGEGKGGLLRRDPAMGRRLPDTPLVGSAGGSSSLFDLLRSSDFVVLVLGLGGDRHPPQLEAVRDRSSSCDGAVRVVGVWPAVEVAPEGSLVDEEGALHAHLRVSSPELFLVRPDGHLAFRGPPKDAQRLLAFLDRLLLPGAPAISNGNESEVQ